MSVSRFIESTTLLALIAGALIGGLISFVLLKQDSTEKKRADKNQPLYWVAPMDPNYRRDTPGKSPMGMDLIPVYEKEKPKNDAGAGTITIAPNIVNSLGVRTAVVERGMLDDEIYTVGYVKYDENKLIHIHPRVSGWIDKLHVKATGDPVKKGAPLYSLYSPELVNAQEELIIAINRNNTRLIKAAEDRLKALQIPRTFVKKLKRNKLIQQSVTFFSPQDGVIDNLSIREGFYVQPGTTLFSIGALDRVWVEAEVFERQVSLVKKGQKVTMTLDYIPGVAWEGKVDYIYPTLDSETRTVRLRLEFENPDKQLLPNMFAQVIVHSETNEDVLLIPHEALIRTGDQDRVVLALGDGSFKSIEITVGREDRHHIEVLGGLKENDEIVASAQFLLDSESSKTSDFIRMDAEETTNAMLPESVWVAGIIKARFPNERTITVSHEAIEAWNMMAMTMNFHVADTIEFSALEPGAPLHMEITMGESGMYDIVDIHIKSNDKRDGDKNVHEEMDHSQMDHSQMKHDDHLMPSMDGE